MKGQDVERKFDLSYNVNWKPFEFHVDFEKHEITKGNEFAPFISVKNTGVKNDFSIFYNLLKLENNILTSSSLAETERFSLEYGKFREANPVLNDIVEVDNYLIEIAVQKNISYLNLDINKFWKTLLWKKRFLCSITNSIEDKKIFNNELKHDNSKTNVVTDNRDGQKYNTVSLGNQIWITENLRFKIKSNATKEFNASLSNNCGLLYTWDEAKNACPDGFRLPTDADWKELELHLGLSKLEINKEGCRGTNIGQTLKNSLNITYCGSNALSGKHVNVDVRSPFWTATEYKIGDAWARNFDTITNCSYRNNYSKKQAFSVRCIKE